MQARTLLRRAAAPIAGVYPHTQTCTLKSISTGWVRTGGFWFLQAASYTAGGRMTVLGVDVADAYRRGGADVRHIILLRFKLLCTYYITSRMCQRSEVRGQRSDNIR
jgi:hypothetical protein